MKLLIITAGCFGYNTDTYEWCKYLRQQYDITYLCLDRKRLPRITLDGIHVRYVPSWPPRIIRGLLLLLYSVALAFFWRGKIFVIYNPTSMWLRRIVFWRKMHLDIRTLSVSPDEAYNQKNDHLIAKSIRAYSSVSFISDGVRKKMSGNIDITKNQYILPLGANVVSEQEHTFDDIRMLYVGTFFNRRLEDTLYGLRVFKDTHPVVDIQYIVIGSGSFEEELLLQNTIQKLDLSDCVKLIGFVQHDKLKKYFDWANVGVSYVPITEYYEYQPPTKTYEYILSGLYCIGTNTFANREVIMPDNGILIHDSPEGFCQGLDAIVAMNPKPRSETIRKTLQEFTWENIIKRKLIPILESL